MALSRRQFLTRVGQAGGYSAAFTMMQSLGLLPMPEASAQQQPLTRVSGNGARILILGGGRTAPTPETLERMRHVRFPASDPLTGTSGALPKLWSQS